MKLYYPELALHVPSLLLPRDKIPIETWSVIACDQYTSEPEYWHEVERVVGTAPSTLNLIYPEAFLAANDRDTRVADINATMRRYLDGGVLVEQPPGFMLVERELGPGRSRRGLIVALDLEQYDYRDGARELIRTTEGTDPSRLPPRIQVRREASLEVPHIMVLIDDPRRTVIEPLFDRDLEQAYDVTLMAGGGRVRGWRVDSGIDDIALNLGALINGDPPILYAMGDGNHSFATAQAVWEQIRSELPRDHPARFAMVELVNLHDESLQFEPIHRFIYDVDPKALLAKMTDHGFVNTPGGHHIPYITSTGRGDLYMPQPQFKLEVATLHDFLDQTDAKIDYIHGDETLARLVQRPDSIGFLLPAIDKHELFESIRVDGATPRKTFSIGEAHEKRYYLECRRLR